MPNTDDKIFGDEIHWVSSQPKLIPKVDSQKRASNDDLSFWSDAPAFNTSLDPHILQLPDNKFIVEKIDVISYNRKVLYGFSQVAVISGIFAESNFKVGQTVTILPCLCCLSNSPEIVSCDSILPEDVLFDSSINMKSSFGSDKIIFYVDDTRNIILVEDNLLTITSFCTAMECINKPLLQDSVASFSFEFGHQSLALGTIIHSLIESALINRKSSFTFLVSEAKRIIKDNILLLYSCNITDKVALNEILKHIKNIIKLLDKNYNILKVENRVFSPGYGLKGDIDCLSDSLVIEIKTGKYMSVEHRTQAIMYTIVVIENEISKLFTNYRQFISECCEFLSGKSRVIQIQRSKIKYTPLLYYVKSGDFIKINMLHEELTHLLKVRNDIASNKKSVLCSCPENSPCGVLRIIKSLSPLHFLKRQLEAIDLEADRKKAYFCAKKISQKNTKICIRVSEHTVVGEYVYFYTTSHKFITLGIVEEHNGNEVKVALRESIDLEEKILICLDNDSNFLKFLRWSLIYVAFPKFAKGSEKGPGIDSFLLPGQEYGLGIREDDECSMEDDDILNSIDTAMCSVDTAMCSINTDDVEISSIDLGSDFSNNSCRETNYRQEREIIKLTPKSATQKEVTSQNRLKTLLISETSQGDENIHNTHLKPEILFNEKEPPIPIHYFTPPSVFQNYKFIIPEDFRTEFQKLNVDQQQALFSALNCENYEIIHGMPGCGKSTVISLLIKILLSYKKKVLIICYTHLAIENILCKIGNIKKYWAKKESLKFQTTADATKYFDSIDLVAGTCYSFNDVVYLKRRFDYCVIDEASQIHLLLALIPISISERFCMVGDHLQLKPLCKESLELGQSLFEALIGKCTILKTQYRMGDAIMRLSNELFYGGKLIGFGGISTVNFIDSEKTDVMKYVKDAANCVILCYFNTKVQEISELNKNVKVTTIDRFQGSEHDNIIVIFDPVESCAVIESSERLNVALTRAKRLLTLIGNKRKMEDISLFKRLLNLLSR